MNYITCMHHRRLDALGDNSLFTCMTCRTVVRLKTESTTGNDQTLEHLK